MRTLAAILVASFLLATGAAPGFTQAQPQPGPAPTQQQNIRGPRASDRSIVIAHRVVLRLIRALQRDQRDYGGYRVRAIQDLQQAAQDLQMAIQYDRQHEQQGSK